MIEALGFEFFRNALIAGFLASIACGVIGSFVVVKRMASLAGGISHAAFGGIGLGYFLGISPLAGAAAVALGTSAATAWIRMKADQHLDTLVGAIWATGMAAGILFIYITPPGFAPDLFSYLFGNILLVPPRETLLVMALLTAGICGIVAILYPPASLPSPLTRSMLRDGPAPGPDHGDPPALNRPHGGDAHPDRGYHPCDRPPDPPCRHRPALLPQYERADRWCVPAGHGIHHRRDLALLCL